MESPRSIFFDAYCGDSHEVVARGRVAFGLQRTFGVELGDRCLTFNQRGNGDVFGLDVEDVVVFKAGANVRLDPAGSKEGRGERASQLRFLARSLLIK